MYLINSNRLLLLGRSLGNDKMAKILEHMRADPVVQEVYRAKSEVRGLLRTSTPRTLNLLDLLRASV